MGGRDDRLDRGIGGIEATGDASVAKRRVLLLGVLGINDPVDLRFSFLLVCSSTAPSLAGVANRLPSSDSIGAAMGEAAFNIM